ncbi:MAG: enoyl-CoA hydratase/isomerase family protein, partial [Burkholderiaceae bacterium]
SGDRAENDVRLHDVLLGLKPVASFAPGPMQSHSRLIDELSGGPDFMTVCSGIARLAGHEDPWLDRAARTFKAGAPGSARLCFELLRRVRRLSLAEAFRQEYIVSLQCGVQGDFQEGVRALLIDKDKRPKWDPASLEEASDQWVQRFFKPAWPDSVAHPLADLGKA